MEPSTEQVDRILTEVFSEVARTFTADGRGVVIEKIESWEENEK